GATVPGTFAFNPLNETNAGSYNVTGTFTSSSTNYQSGGTDTATMTISKASVTATAGSGTWVYNGSTETLPLCTLVGSYTAGLSCVDAPASVGPGVTSGPVSPNVTVISGDLLTNYAITSNNGTYSITPATTTVTITCPVSVTYTGAVQTPCM